MCPASIPAALLRALISHIGTAPVYAYSGCVAPPPRGSLRNQQSRCKAPPKSAYSARQTVQFRYSIGVGGKIVPASVGAPSRI